MSFVNSEVMPAASQYFLPLQGRLPYNKKNVDDYLAAALKALDVLEKHLLVNTFFVGERLTLADIFVAGLVSRSFENICDKEWRKQNPNLGRWYETVTKQPIYKEIVPNVTLCDERPKNAPPQGAGGKKEKAQQQPKKEKEASKPKAAAAKEADEEEDEPAPTPKAKHPLEALPKPTLVLDDWKRKYSNEDTRKVALPWFWENFKSEEYSLWKLDYKYNDELTMVFMSSNLIGKHLPLVGSFR